MANQDRAELHKTIWRMANDLRGSVAFRSTYNSATGTWSQKTASGLNMSVYFYSFRGVNGDKFDGRIFTNEEL